MIAEISRGTRGKHKKDDEDGETWGLGGKTAEGMASEEKELEEGMRRRKGTRARMREG